MTERPRRGKVASRPGDVESRIKSPEAPTLAAAKNGAFTARLTIDVTSELRGRIKSRRSSAASPWPTCCATFSSKPFPTSMEARHEGPDQHLMRA
jgi:hypothetical protein